MSANNVNAQVTVNINVTDILRPNQPTVYQQNLNPAPYLGNALTAQQLVLNGVFSVTFPSGTAFCGMIYARNLSPTNSTTILMTVEYSDTNLGAFLLNGGSPDGGGFLLYYIPGTYPTSGLIFPLGISFTPSATPCPMEYALVSNTNP